MAGADELVQELDVVLMVQNLHAHSVFCDGKNTPEEVIRLAYEQGFRLIALSDHNTFAITQKIRIGEGEALMEVIPACEFSCSYYVPSMKENREIHVVGLFPGADGVDLEIIDGASDLFDGAMSLDFMDMARYDW